MIHHLRALAVFARAVELGSFRAAARELKLSPSVVSHHISQLEEQLGVALIYRSTRSLSLTREGEQLFGAAQVMINAAEGGINAVLNKAGALGGELHVTAPAILAQSRIADRIALFLRRHEHVKITIDYSDMPRDLISEGIDVAIRMGWLRDGRLKARKLYDVDRVLIASRTYLTGRTLPKSPKDVEAWDWLELAPVPLKPVFRHKTLKSVRLRLTPRLSANSAAALYQLVKRGAGIAILPRFIAESDISNGDIEVLLPDWKLPAVAVSAVRPHNAPKLGLAAAFADFIAE